jgi:hypothetical protein
MANLREYLGMIQQMAAMNGGQANIESLFSGLGRSAGASGGGRFIDEDEESSQSDSNEESGDDSENKTGSSSDQSSSKQVRKRKTIVKKNNKKVKNSSSDELTAPEGFDKHHIIYSYFKEMDTTSKRIVSVAYRRDIKTGYTHYGACIFRKEYPDETFVKATHKKTAYERLMKKPIIFQKTAETKAEFLKYLRKMIHRYGVCRSD